MIRTALPAALCLGLVACGPQVPNSGAGFQDYNTYQQQRAQQGTEPMVPNAPDVSAQPLDGAPAAGSDAETAAAAMAALGADTSTAPTGPQPMGAIQPAQPAVGESHARISDEQDFSAVAERESIESDRERLEAQREAYRVIPPTALPSRDGANGPNIVAYALQTTNRVGEPQFRRTFGSANKAARVCATFASPDLAQEAFLATGGPDRDRRGMDPDGDGFACGWDPSPFRAARGS